MLKGDRDFGNSLEIAGRQVGPGQPVFVVAEMSANHGGSLSKAVEILRAACDAGADAVKLQTYTPDTMTLDSARPEFSIGAGTLWEGRRLIPVCREDHTQILECWEDRRQVGRSSYVGKTIGRRVHVRWEDHRQVLVLREHHR